MQDPPPWQRGRAALLYKGAARSLVMGLKHGDRHDIARPAARWMATLAEPLTNETTIIAPIPLHWTRFLKRRFNQSALLADRMARDLDTDYIPDLLIRDNATSSLDGLSREERFEMLSGSLSVNPKFLDVVRGASVLLVDDVMTSGATLSVATKACLQANADQVNVIVLARVAKRP